MVSHRGLFALSILIALILNACRPVMPVEEAAPIAEASRPTRAIIYVDGSASGADDGSSWTNAYTSLQDALSGAGDDSEIWVAAGRYKPSEKQDRSATFQLKDGVAVYGGFAGTETGRAQRDWQTHLTLLSGDLLGDDGANFANYSDNSNNVVVTSGTGSSAILDGFTVTGGNALPSADVEHVQLCAEGCGGGMYNEGGSPTLTNIVFSANMARYGGGGLQNIAEGNPTLTNVTFTGNSARFGGGMANFQKSEPILAGVIFSENMARDEGEGTGGGGGIFNDHSSPALTDVSFIGNGARAGGGMFNYEGSHPTLTDVTFVDNIALGSGGGMFNYVDSNPTLTNVSFMDNTASSGGGMLNSESDPTLTRVSFTENTASSGGGMLNSDSHPMLTNITLSDNVASSNGGGIFNFASHPTLTNVSLLDNVSIVGGGMYNDTSDPLIRNSILWGNSANVSPEIHNVGSTPTITRSLVQGSPGSGDGWDQSLGTDGGDNLDGIPLSEDVDISGLQIQSDSASTDTG